VRNAAYFVQKATAADGEVVYEHKAAPKQVVDPKVANDVTLSLEPIAAWSNDPLANGRVSAAKTGTEGIGHTQNTSDGWMVGYTPQVSAAVWTGSGNSVTPIYNAAGLAEYGSDLSGKTWALFMDSYLADKPGLPMATTQLVTGGENIAAPPTHSASPSKTPTPSPSHSTGTSSVPPSTPATSATPTTTATATCTPKIFPPKTCPPPGG
jgi:membrane peptidoglycan carboxypeptidase